MHLAEFRAASTATPIPMRYTPTGRVRESACWAHYLERRFIWPKASFEHRDRDAKTALGLSIIPVLLASSSRPAYHAPIAASARGQRPAVPAMDHSPILARARLCGSERAHARKSGVAGRRRVSWTADRVIVWARGAKRQLADEATIGRCSTRSPSNAAAKIATYRRCRTLALTRDSS